jgi:putative phosphoribosyl transferase
MAEQFANRTDAGKILARRLVRFAGRNDVIVLGLPRGGVPVAYEIAIALKSPLDILTVRKIGVPYHPELAMGAVAAGGTYAVHREVVSALGITDDEFLAVLKSELNELRRREVAYRDDRPPPQLSGKIVILVDDGLATGSSMRVAIDAVRRQNPAKIIVAVPVAPQDTQTELAKLVDEIVCARTPEPFYAVGASYSNFDQVGDTMVRELLAKAMCREAL